MAALGSGLVPAGVDCAAGALGVAVLLLSDCAAGALGAVLLLSDCVAGALGAVLLPSDCVAGALGAALLPSGVDGAVVVFGLESVAVLTSACGRLALLLLRG